MYPARIHYLFLLIIMENLLSDLIQYGGTLAIPFRFACHASPYFLHSKQVPHYGLHIPQGDVLQ